MWLDSHNNACIFCILFIFTCGFTVVKIFTSCNVLQSLVRLQNTMVLLFLYDLQLVMVAPVVGLQDVMVAAMDGFQDSRWFMTSSGYVLLVDDGIHWHHKFLLHYRWWCQSFSGFQHAVLHSFGDSQQVSVASSGGFVPYLVCNLLIISLSAPKLLQNSVLTLSFLILLSWFTACLLLFVAVELGFAACSVCCY